MIKLKYIRAMQDCSFQAIVKSCFTCLVRKGILVLCSFKSFKRVCSAILWGQVSANVQACLSIRCLHMWSIPFSHEPVPFHETTFAVWFLSQLMRVWYSGLPFRRPAMAQANLRIHAVSLEPSLFAHIKYGSRQRARPKIRHLAPLYSCACAFEEWVDGGWKVP